MAVAKLELANQALAYLLRDGLSSLESPKPTLEERTMRLHMQQAIEEVIEEYDWPQCRVIANLNSVTPNLRGWTYAYAIPSDAVVIWRISDLRGATVNKFEVGMTDDVSSDTNYIFTDDADLAIRYGSRRASLGRFTPQTFDLMARKLAIKGCLPITKDKRLFQLLESDYPKKLSAVKTRVANLEPEVTDIEFVPESILVRSQ